MRRQCTPLTKASVRYSCVPSYMNQTLGELPDPSSSWLPHQTAQQVLPSSTVNSGALIIAHVLSSVPR